MNSRTQELKDSRIANRLAVFLHSRVLECLAGPINGRKDREVVLVVSGQPSYNLNGMADPQRTLAFPRRPAHEWKLAMQTGCLPFARSI